MDVDVVKVELLVDVLDVEFPELPHYVVVGVRATTRVGKLNTVVG